MNDLHSTRRTSALIRLALLGLVGVVGIACATADRGSVDDADAQASADPIRRDVRSLSAEDFRVRTTAARRLVDRGAEAVPALGEAAGDVDAVALRAVLEQIQMQLAGDDLRRCLASSFSTVRASACRVAADRSLVGLVRPMIELLRDDDGSVRAVALTSLRRLTRHFEGRSAGDFEDVLARRAGK